MSCHVMSCHVMSSRGLGGFEPPDRRKPPGSWENRCREGSIPPYVRFHPFPKMCGNFPRELCATAQPKISRKFWAVGSKASKSYREESAFSHGSQFRKPFPSSKISRKFLNTLYFWPCPKNKIRSNISFSLNLKKRRYYSFLKKNIRFKSIITQINNIYKAINRSKNILLLSLYVYIFKRFQYYYSYYKRFNTHFKYYIYNH